MYQTSIVWYIENKHYDVAMILYHTVRYKNKNYDVIRILYGIFNRCCMVLNDTALLLRHIFLVFIVLHHSVLYCTINSAISFLRPLTRFNQEILHFWPIKTLSVREKTLEKSAVYVITTLIWLQIILFIIDY